MPMTKINELRVPPTEIEGTIDLLRSALTSKDVLLEPWVSGVVPLTPSESSLFYKRQDGTPGAIDLCSTTSAAQAEDLSGACQPATFGRGQKDVLDLTYRKAGKLDAGNFLWGFNPDNGAFTEKIASGLFHWQSLDKGIGFELYKLNVYGEGSFFKAHQDTPRNQDMFGSLVVVLPFSHEGGDLLLRHRGREHTFNGSALLKKTSAPSAAYIAFFSDVEHEVALVKSGHRVTITYNIYFDPAKGAPIFQTPISSRPEHPFETALEACLDDKAIRRAYPFLGFGLEHAYPFESAILRPGKLNFKGSDATLIRTLSDLEIDFEFYLLYSENATTADEICPFRVLSKTIINIDQSVHGWEDNDSLENIFNNEPFLIWDQPKDQVTDTESSWYDYYQQDPNYRSLPVEWVTEPKAEYVDKSLGLAYGNEPTFKYFYHHLCVVATIARPEEIPDLGGNLERFTGIFINI